MSSFLTTIQNRSATTTIATNKYHTPSPSPSISSTLSRAQQMQFYPLTWLGAIAASAVFGKAEARAIYSGGRSSSLPTSFVSASTRTFQSRSTTSVAGTVWTSRYHAVPHPNDGVPSIAPIGVFSFGWRSKGTTATSSTALDSSAKGEDESDVPNKGPPPPRIAVIGGGIAGVTAARSIAKELATSSKSTIKKADIVVYEGDANGGPLKEPFAIQRKAQPTWGAATAKNANSLVPGVAMHVMSQRSI